MINTQERPSTTQYTSSFNLGNSASRPAELSNHTPDISSRSLGTKMTQAKLVERIDTQNGNLSESSVNHDETREPSIQAISVRESEDSEYMRRIQEDHLRTGSEDFEGIINKEPGDYGISDVKYSRISALEAGTTWNSVIEQSESRI